MRRLSAAAGLIFLGMFHFFMSGAAAPQGDLWQKAVETARRNKPWIPGITVLSFEVLDGSGKLTDSYTSHIRISPDQKGRPLMHVESAVRNGKDVTDSESEKQEKRNQDAAGKPGSSPFSLGDNPFDPDVQASVEARPTGEGNVTGERACILFSFSVKKKSGETLIGTAALDRESGEPVEVSYTQKPLPFGVQTMTMSLTYGSGPLGGGFLREVGIEGSGQFLFFKRGFRSRIVLDGYWKSEAL
jgi:hypothetical protein